MKRRPVYANAHELAMESARKLRPEARLALQAIISDALVQFHAGRGDCAAHWRTMADALNTAEMLAGMGIASDDASKARIDDAMRVLADVYERHEARGRWTLRWPEVQALSDGLFIARIQLEHCSLGEFEKARKQVAERIRHARAGNAPDGAHVVGSEA